MSHLVIMPAQENKLPFGTHIEKCNLIGSRVPVKHLRAAGHMSVISAHWPDNGLCENMEPVLLCVISGCATIQIGTQLLTCNEGNFIFIPPELPHPNGTRPFSKNGTKCSILWIRRCGHGLRCWISHSSNDVSAPCYRSENIYFFQEQILDTYDTLCDELLERRSGATSHHALMLFLLLMRQELFAGRAFNISTTQRPEADQEGHSHLNNDPLQLAEDYIQSHLINTLTIEIVARHVHMSRANFAKLFHQRTGKTFLQYVHHHRLQQARTFLRETTWTVRTIAELCGFASQSGFSRFFLKQEGATPLTYRNQHR